MAWRLLASDRIELLLPLSVGVRGAMRIVAREGCGDDRRPGVRRAGQPPEAGLTGVSSACRRDLNIGRVWVGFGQLGPKAGPGSARFEAYLTAGVRPDAARG